jgi:hypothetical protein
VLTEEIIMEKSDMGEVIGSHPPLAKLHPSA